MSHASREPDDHASREPDDLVGVFAARVAEHPDATAITCAERAVDYRELDESSDAVRRFLEARGADTHLVDDCEVCGPELADEAPVGVFMDRGVDVVAAMVGTVKAGRPYVPLDIRSPAARLRLILDECGIGLVLVDTAERAARVREFCAEWVDVVCFADAVAPPRPVATGSVVPPGPVVGAPPRPRSPRRLAYVIHTSGSTGVPKGVEVEHRDLVAFAADPCWSDGLDRRVLQYSPLAFDASVFEIWMPLLRGGRVVVAPPGEVDAGVVARLIKEEGVTCAFVTTSLFNVMVEQDPAVFAGIGQVWMGGEAASPLAVSRALRAGGAGTVVNVYGPTEGTIFAAFHVPAEPVGAPVPIGSAMAGVRTYVLDERLDPVETGADGELCLGGRGVARGYRGRPGITADRFVPDPFAGGGARMYRTGDIVRRRPDGLLEFVGRRDRQVKVRGFRVELGEIESRLVLRPDVAGAAVLAVPDAHGDKTIVAYLVPRRDTPGGDVNPRVGEASWGRWVLGELAASLPAYMVPTDCVVLDALPLTPNGKVDSAALPAPTHAVDGRAPRSAVEELLCEVFADLLGLDRVGIDDNFIELGGHSLLATRAVARIAAAGAGLLRVVDVFEAPTPATLALRLDAAARARTAERPPPTPRPRPDVIPLSFAQRRLWLVNRLEGSANPDYHIPLLFRLHTEPDPEALRAALRDVIERHESLRTVFPVHDDVPHQHILDIDEFGVRIPVTDCADDAVDAEVTRAARAPFDLTTRLPIRAELIRTPHESLLLVVVHHISADGWSLTTLTRDLGRAYAARMRGTRPDAAPLPLQYRDYAAWQREQLGDENDPDSPLGRQLTYWTQRLADAPAGLTLPTDRPRPIVAGHAGDVHAFELPADLCTALDDLARSAHTTLFVALHAGLAGLLTRLGAGEDIVVGSPIAGRADAVLDDLIGFFVNTVVLRTNTSGDPTFAELLARVDRSWLPAYAHQDVPFDLLVEKLNPVRSLSRHPIFQVSLGLLNTPDAITGLPGLADPWTLANTRSAKFDLAFHLFPHRTETGRPDRIDATVEYATDLFDRDTVRRMADRLVRLLREAVAHPHRPLGALTILDDAELAALRPIEPAAHPEHDTPIAAFHARVAAHPEAQAVGDGENPLTYRELSQRARALADGLTDVDAPVALVLEPGVDAVTATVGVIEAGGTYVPLDPALPDRRLATILADSGAGTVLVDHPERAERVRGLVGPTTRVLRVADTIRAGSAAPTGSASAEIDPDQVARIAYTSDPAGVLVGVCTSHRDLLTAPDRPGEPILRCSGPTHEAGPYQPWARLMRGDGVDAAGEPDSQAPPRADGPGTRLVDETGALVGIGMIGELCLAEPGIASGYLGRPALTAERFVPDPYGPPGSRMYRTGDLFHRRTDGSADHVGRRDRQLRVDGRRIEPAEIEVALTEHAGVAEAVVVRRDDEHLGEILVGYLVPTPDHPELDDRLPAFLAERLPAYLVPTALVPLPALPRTPAGTVDETALPALDLADPSRPPRTAEERALCALYAQTLDLPEVRLDDSFFELGGNSLAAIRLVGRLRAEHAIEVPVKNVFRHPTPAAFLAGMPTEARLRLTGPDHDRDPDEHTIPRTTTADDLVPLSFAQRRLWFLDQLWPNRPDYNLPVALRLTGPLDPDRLRAALTALVARHDILRTRYVLRDDEARQLVEPAGPIEPRELDLRTLPIEGALPAADAAIADDLGRPFDLAAAPPMRTLLLRLADDDHILFVVVHHIATDGWSSEVLCRELADRYRLGARYEPDPPVLRYADYAAWESGAAADPARRAQADYWRTHLAGLTSVELPGDRPRPPVMSGRGEQFDFEIPADLRRRLLDLSRTHESTPFITLLTAFQVLVARRTGARDIAVGTPVAGRGHPELDELIGLFVNTLVLRVDLDPALGFADLIARTRADAAAAYSHQDLPFEQLVDELRPERDLGRNPLFQLMFSMADVNPAPADWGQPAVAPHPVPFRAAKLDLEIAVAERGDTYLGSVYYATDLFDPATIERLARDYVQLLAALVERPDAPVGGLGHEARLGAPDALGSAPDRAEALASPATGDSRYAVEGTPEAGAEPYARWNDTAVDHDLDHCLHDLFARQARRTPHTAAVIAGRETLGYAELDRRANRFAHRLVAHGVRPGLPVGLRLDRGPDLAVALLGILKAGGAYLPLDPDLPPARAGQLLDEAGTDICVVDAPAGGALPADAGIRTITVDSAAPDARSDTPPEVPVDPDDLVSIYYTSGSTGKPKGVANPHRGWVNRMWWMHRRHGLAVGDRVLHKTVLSFDDSAVELFWPWLVGGTVVMLEPGLHRDPRAILRAAVEHEISVLQFVPSMLGLFLDELDADGPAGLDRLRVVVSSGEALRPDLVARFYTHLDAQGCRLHNQWGPTEASIDATHHVCGPEDAQADTVPIGLPLDNYRVHVLDADLRPVPIGVEGELHVGGPGLARGYWTDPLRTAEAFVPDPDTPGERLYRTGDRAIRRPDGELLFLGRVDHQVKIRGIRVELGEIEAMLVAHPDIADAVVTKWEPTPGDHRLLAYLVAAAGTRPESEHVRAYLGERLPPYLVPTRLTLLDALPLSPNGKVDRRRLPAPERDAEPAVTPGPVRAPETDAELLVAQVWAEFLAADDADANFFALGGHSLLATRIVSRLRRALDVDLPLVLLFEHPTIAGLAAAIEAELLGEPTDDDSPAGDCDD